MPKNLLAFLPEARINDLFSSPESELNFTLPTESFKDPIIEGIPNIDHRFKAEFYQKIGVDIVAETAIHYPYTFITEKTYRPIANGRPFIILGPTNTLEFLKSLGFKTFSSVIDESYDTISDPEKRFYQVCRSIKKFVDRPLDAIVNDISYVKPELLHNINSLALLREKQLQSFKEQIKKKSINIKDLTVKNFMSMENATQAVDFDRREL